MSVLELREVVVEIGDARLLDGVTLEIAPGRVCALVGANGAGKTTLLDAVCGEIASTAGEVLVDGRPVTRRVGTAPPRDVGRVFQGSPLPETLTVSEVAVLATGDRGAADRLMGRFGLRVHATTFVAELSTGMRRILDLAVAAAREPRLLILDEPASGLAPSEVDELAAILLRWRDETGGSILIVEHDTGLLRRVADEVVVLNAGQVIGTGSPEEMLGGHAAARLRVRNPADEGFKDALARVASDAEPPAPPVKRTVSTWTLMRLGLREFAAGMSAVLILGVLNRVMKVELGISLLVVAAVLASYNLAAPIALPIGHMSDHRPILGRRRGPYIVGGACLAGFAVALAPYVGDMLQRGITPFSVLVGVLLFTVMGVGMYGAGSVYFALLADMVPPAERGHAASIVYFELMAGIFAGVALTGSVLDDDASGIKTLFALAGVLIVAFTSVAVWGQERKALERGPYEPDPAGHVRFRDAVGSIARMSQARRFFVFMIAATLFLFLQQAVLEPFGGEVLGLNVRQTSAFNGMMTAGILLGMWIGGRPVAERWGYMRLARIGLVGSVFSFAFLTFAAATASAPPSWISIFGIGVAMGLFNVAALALMMGMADAKRTALFMGAWTMAHSLADGAAVAGGGLIFEVAHRVLDSVPGGYATVFAIEAVGLACCIPLLSGIDPRRFAQEAGLEEATIAAPVAVPAPVEPVPVEAASANGRPSTPRRQKAAAAKGSGSRGKTPSRKPARRVE
ncbi:MAG TPA: MFS transporter [Actinomycetota bacterium]|nr:MFS transporter [Actinomycetota bacterium]